jgi:hypothetical protein
MCRPIGAKLAQASFPSVLRWSSRWRWMSFGVRRVSITRRGKVFL